MMTSSEKYKLHMMADSIFHLRIEEGSEIELEDALSIHSSLLQFSGGRKYMVLFNTGQFFAISPEARFLIASEEYTRDRMAMAFVTNSLPGKLICNFFIKHHRPSSPAKIFSNVDDAYSWLITQMGKAYVEQQRQVKLAC